MIFNLLPYDKDSSKLYEDTFNKALYNLAQKYHLGYDAPHVVTLEHIQKSTFRMPTIDNSLVFMSENHNWTSETENKIRKNCPNAKIILVSSDGVYYKEAITKMNVELYLTTMKSEVAFLSKYGKTEHFYWTISNDIIEDVKQVPETDKKYIGICLCKNSFRRSRFFNEVQRLLGYPIVWGVDEFDSNKVYNLYKSSYFCLGITMAAPGCGDFNERTMKGYRDFLGVACGAMLVCDDYPDIIDLKEIPIYKFESPSDLANLIYKYGQDPDLRMETLKKQQELLSKITMESQLEQILIKHSLI